VKIKFWIRNVLKEKETCQGEAPTDLSKEAILDKIHTFADMISPIRGESLLEEYSNKAYSDGVFFILCLLGSFIGSACVYYNKLNSDWTVIAYAPTFLATLIFSFIIGSKINVVNKTIYTA